MNRIKLTPAEDKMMDEFTDDLKHLFVKRLKQLDIVVAKYEGKLPQHWIMERLSAFHSNSILPFFDRIKNETSLETAENFIPVFFGRTNDKILECLHDKDR